jgi:hypothetical protein
MVGLKCSFQLITRIHSYLMETRIKIQLGELLSPYYLIQKLIYDGHVKLVFDS